MSNKNIKVGGIGNLRVIVVNVDEDGWFKFRTDEKNMAFILSPDEVAQAFTPLPKYDPCRPFREGDIVTPCQVKGRWCSSAWKGRAGMHFIVTKDEDGNYEFKDEETGAEYVIELDADGNDEEAEVEDDLDLDVEGDEEEESFEIELDDEEDDDNIEGDEEEESFEIELDDEEDEEEDELLSEENLGYTDSYQKDVFAKKPNMSVPGKNNEDWSEGVPTGAEKPWAGKGDMKPFGEKKQELDENGNGLNAKHAMKKTQNRLNKDAQGQHVTSEEGEYKGTLSEDKARKIINAAKAIQAENKLYKESIEKIKKSLYEAAVLNVNLGKIVSLLVNETTTKEEKQNILERFNNVKTLKEGNALYESIKKELNGSAKKTPIMERQISMSPSLNETTFYTQSNPSLNLMERMNNLETYYKK